MQDTLQKREIEKMIYFLLYRYGGIAGTGKFTCVQRPKAPRAFHACQERPFLEPTTALHRQPGKSIKTAILDLASSQQFVGIHSSYRYVADLGLD